MALWGMGGVVVEITSSDFALMQPPDMPVVDRDLCSCICRHLCLAGQGLRTVGVFFSPNVII